MVQGPARDTELAVGELMDRALALGASARRRTAPNPWVGCVIAVDGVIVGEGATQPPGGAHAEAQALAAAGDRARGATAYVTLEPCSHHGRTPPCADALVDAGIARVVVAVLDPDPLVAGSGIARLRERGVPVELGVRAAAATHSLRPYLVHRSAGRAATLVKVATSIDGRIAASDGSSQWITGPAARADAHELRADAQAVMVGSGTALADHPRLTVREVAAMPDHQPLRVLLDGRGRVPAEGPLFDTTLAPTLVLTTDAAPDDAVARWLAAGAKVQVLPAAAGERGVELRSALEHLAGLGVLQVLVEGGATLAGSLLGADLADQVVAYVGPTVLGADGRPLFDLPGPATIDDAPRWRLAGVAALDDDVRLDYVPAVSNREA
ncbi:MAG: bifunctional diaminohydroxyphosphoribosylaminopyrimidine deaminase/5-amino-6-(5-phosphoribosylamino)uracil reductase RibD [Acidimicrobiia bacterium]